MSNVEKASFVLLVGMIVQKDKTADVALGSRKPNDSCIKVKSNMPTMEQLLNQKSKQIQKRHTEKPKRKQDRTPRYQQETRIGKRTDRQ